MGSLPTHSESSNLISMRKLTPTLCLTLCTCLFATSAVAKTVHIGCFGPKSTIENTILEISINFTEKEVTLTGTPFDVSFNTDAFITGKTITFKNSKKQDDHVKNSFSWKLDRETLKLNVNI